MLPLLRATPPRFSVSAAVVSFVIIVAWTSTASHPSDAGVGRGGGGGGGGGHRGGPSRCPTDVREETQRCLDKYTEQLEALEEADDRFFPGLDVEVIRSLCSLLEDSVKCAQSLNDACQKTEVSAIKEELGPHLSVSRLCSLNNIYEDYAMNQNCFLRIKTESKFCHQRFQQTTTIDEQQRSASSSSSSSWYSQRHHTLQQQRQYCSQVSQLVVCVKNEVRRNQNSCSRTALTLVGSLVRASLTSSVVCSDEENATTPSSPAGKSNVVVSPSDNSRSSASAFDRADDCFRLVVCCSAAAALYLTSVLSSSSSSSVTFSPRRRRSRRRYHRLK